MKFATTSLIKEKTALALCACIAACIMFVLPNAAKAQYNDMLYSPNQPTQSLRTPLLPTAPFSAPYQSASQGQPPAFGDGSTPAPVVGGDMAPFAPPSGFADQTHGNIFGTQQGRNGNGPWMYQQGSGRHSTQNGQQQGVYESGEEIDGTRFGPGGKNGGTAKQNHGGPRGDSEGLYESGDESAGTRWGPGGKNGGTAKQNHGGPRGDSEGLYESGDESAGTRWGPGGKNGGSAVQNHGGARGDAEGMGGGGNNGGTRWGPGGKNGGREDANDGGPRGNAEQGGPGSGGNGKKFINDGGPRSNSYKDGNGGEMAGQKFINNGGPRSDAEKEGDRLFQHAQQPSRYEFNGPIPTARTFSRYLVILGVVFATVFVAIAAWSMVFGSPYGASRVIGAVGGLLLLLAGYTIWKIVQMNTFHANSTGWESHHRGGAPQHLKNGPYTIQNTPQGGPFAPPQDPGGNTNGGGNNGGGNNGGGNNGGGGNPSGGNTGTVGDLL